MQYAGHRRRLRVGAAEHEEGGAVVAVEVPRERPQVLAQLNLELVLALELRHCPGARSVAPAPRHLSANGPGFRLLIGHRRSSHEGSSRPYRHALARAVEKSAVLQRDYVVRRRAEERGIQVREAPHVDAIHGPGHRAVARLTHGWLTAASDPRADGAASVR